MSRPWRPPAPLEAAARYAFKGSDVSREAQKLLAAFLAAGYDGLDRTQIRKVFGSNDVPVARIENALAELAGVLRRTREPTAGRPREVWRHVRFALPLTATPIKGKKGEKGEKPTAPNDLSSLSSLSGEEKKTIAVANGTAQNLPVGTFAVANGVAGDAPNSDGATVATASVANGQTNGVDSWRPEIVRAWEQQVRTGEVTVENVGVLKPVIEREGLAVVKAAICAYATTRKGFGQPRKYEWFLKEFGRWLEHGRRSMGDGRDSISLDAN